MKVFDFECREHEMAFRERGGCMSSTVPRPTS
jgi:hypothetical protein